MKHRLLLKSDLRNDQLYLNGSSFSAHLLACVPTEGATSLLVNRLEDMENIIPNLQADEWGISPQEQPPDLQLLFNLEELALWKLDTFKGICPELSIVFLPFNASHSSGDWKLTNVLNYLLFFFHSICFKGYNIWRNLRYSNGRNRNKYLILVVKEKV
ncbi:unnamed protein product [Camellia sinensis]